MHNRRLFYILLCVVLLSALTITLCSAALGIGRYEVVPLQTAGSSEILPDHTVRFTIPLPEEARREHMVFCFRCYNCIVRVLDGETLLLSSGEERVAAGRPIGHMLLSVPVPEDAWGRELTVLAAAQDGTDTAGISSPVLMPASDARLYSLLNKQFDFLIFLPVTLLSLAAVPIFAVLWAFRFRFGKLGFCLSMFLLLTGCWYLGFQGVLWAFPSGKPSAPIWSTMPSSPCRSRFWATCGRSISHRAARRSCSGSNWPSPCWPLPRPS